VREINWDYFGDAVPALLTILTIPLTYKYAHHLSGNLTRKIVTSTCSIAYGVIAGMSSYILINGVTGLLHKVTGGRMVPPSHVNAESWNISHCSFVPVWVFVLISFRIAFVRPN
jgi:adenine/guanine/hypoxanthine permease